MVPPFTRPPLVMLPCLSSFSETVAIVAVISFLSVGNGFSSFSSLHFPFRFPSCLSGGEDIVRMQCFLGGDTLSKLCSHLMFRLWVALCRVFACENFVPENLGCLNWLRTRPPPRHSPHHHSDFSAWLPVLSTFSPSPPIRWVAWEGGPLQNNFCSGTPPVRRRGGGKLFFANIGSAVGAQL